MTHHLENYIRKIHVDTYQTLLQNVFGNSDLNTLKNFTGLVKPFETRDDGGRFWDSVLSTHYNIHSYGDFWINISRPGSYQDTHLHEDYGFDQNEITTKYTAVLYLKFDPELHRPTYFCDNPYKAYEYKPSDIVAGDCLVFPSNIYHRAPLNTSDQTRIVTVCRFNIIN